MGWTSSSCIGEISRRLDYFARMTTPSGRSSRRLFYLASEDQVCWVESLRKIKLDGARRTGGGLAKATLFVLGKGRNLQKAVLGNACQPFLKNSTEALKQTHNFLV